MIDLEIGEKILLRARRHWFFFATKIIALVPLVAIPIILIATTKALSTTNPEAFSYLNNFYNTENGSSALVIFLLFSWFLGLWIVAFIMWTNYYLDVLIVTDRRVINIEQKALFSRETSSMSLDKIQDVSTEIDGILATFLAFGSLRIQTAGEVEQFVLHGLKNPNEVKALILEEHERESNRLRKVVVEKETTPSTPTN